MSKKINFIVFILLLIMFSGYFPIFNFKKQATKNQYFSDQEITDQIKQLTDTKIENMPTASTPQEKISPIEPFAITEKIQQAVPFVTQAPFGNWSDPNFQNGCEEASIIMAMGWINNKKNITPQEAQKEILDIIDFENKTFGYSIDTDTSDIEKIFKQYFKYSNIEIKKYITLDEIKKALQEEKVLIVPVFGRALKNTNFTQPGPIAHMLIIIGYDPTTKEFITNDPGTKNGAGYRYSESLLFEAIWEYPSGATEPPLPINGKIIKAMISISK